jgi:hypothetical protein
VEPGGARPIGEAQLGRDGSTASGVGRGVTRAAPPGSGKEVQRQVGRSEVRPGPGVAGVAVQGALGCGGGMDGSDAREREKREKEIVGSGTIPTYVRRADTSADELKQASLRGGRDTLCSSATR